MSDEELSLLIEKYATLIATRPNTLKEFNDIYASISETKEAIIAALPDGTHPLNGTESILVMKAGFNETTTKQLAIQGITK